MRSSPVFVFAALFGLGVLSASAEDAKTKTVAALHQEKAALAGQTVQVKGKVVKVNNGIMGRNFLHVQDGTGDANTNDLTVTSKQTAAVGDQVTVTGRVVVDRDFGSGYSYPLLVEEASISAAK
jgi:RecJ-like exonuclease